jgi:hypothetical protein
MSNTLAEQSSGIAARTAGDDAGNEISLIKHHEAAGR